MNAHVSVITLGVRDLNQAKQFYSERLGWSIHAEEGDWVCFLLGDGSSALALYLGMPSPTTLGYLLGAPGFGASRSPMSFAQKVALMPF
jgi:catechol 2,3-dioxygenase-like lactoylglutathione lyase family enzyme